MDGIDPSLLYGVGRWREGGGVLIDMVPPTMWRHSSSSAHDKQQHSLNCSRPVDHPNPASHVKNQHFTATQPQTDFKYCFMFV